MHYPVSLIDIVIPGMAAAGAWSTLSDAKGTPRKAWRLAVPPVLASGVSLLILAGAVASFEHDATWMVTTLLGGLLGLLRGGQIKVEMDQVWGTVRTPPAYDSIVVALGLLLVAGADGLSALMPAYAIRHGHMAAASALLAGYLAGRAWSLMRRAARAPHTDLGLAEDQRRA